MNMMSYLSLAPKRRKTETSITLGRIAGSLWREEKLTEGQLNHHVHIVGASGFGKTVLLSHLIRQRIEQGSGLLFIDLKGDRDTIEKFTGFARAANRAEDLKIFSLEDQVRSASYNLVSSGTPTQLRDRIMMSLNWSEEYYRNQSGSFLLKLLNGLCWLRDRGMRALDLATILEAASNRDFLEELCVAIPEDASRERKIMEDLVQFSRASDNWASLQGLRVQLESIVLSEFGDHLADSENGIDLFQAVTEGKIVFLFLDTRRYGETARAIGKFVLQDLKSTSARIDADVPKNERRPFTVFIDEFADLAQEDFIGFLDRARSSKMSVVVAHQELCDLERISPEFAGRLIGSASTLYAFLQKRPESAEMIAGIAGTRRVEEKTEQAERFWIMDRKTGMKSVREVDEFIIHPNIIKNLRVGQCACIKKYPNAQAYLVDVLAPQ